MAGDHSTERVTMFACKWPVKRTVKRGRRQGRQKKRWEDSIREWTRLEFTKSQRAVDNRAKWRKSGCEIICGAPTTLAVKVWMSDDDEMTIRRASPYTQGNGV